MFSIIWKIVPGLVAASAVVSGTAYAAPADASAGERTRFVGLVVAIGDSAFTLETRGGEVLDIAVDSETKYFGRGRSEKSFDDLAIGSMVGGVALEQSDGSLLAKVVIIGPTRTEYKGNGVITEVDEDQAAFHFTNRRGRRWEFYVDANTTITDRQGNSLTLADLEAGMFAHVEADLRSDGKWWATLVRVRPGS